MNTTDSLGNIFNASGTHVGVVPGSAADIGSGGVTFPNNPASIGTLPTLPTIPTLGTAPSSGNPRTDALGLTPSGSAQVATNPGGYSNSITQWISAHIEDFVFIIIGILLIGAGALAFGFVGAEKVVGSASSGVSRVTRTAGKAAKLAELAA